MKDKNPFLEAQPDLAELFEQRIADETRVTAGEPAEAAPASAKPPEESAVSIPDGPAVSISDEALAADVPGEERLPEEPLEEAVPMEAFPETEIAGEMPKATMEIPEGATWIPHSQAAMAAAAAAKAASESAADPVAPTEQIDPEITADPVIPTEPAAPADALAESVEDPVEEFLEQGQDLPLDQGETQSLDRDETQSLDQDEIAARIRKAARKNSSDRRLFGRKKSGKGGAPAAEAGAGAAAGTAATAAGAASASVAGGGGYTGSTDHLGAPGASGGAEAQPKAPVSYPQIGTAKELPDTATVREAFEKVSYADRLRKSIVSTTNTLIVVAAVAVLVAMLFMPVLRIYGQSMNATLVSGELVVSLKGADFETGDIIAFYYNNNVLVKRVIANSGDWVDIDLDGNVYVNQQLIDEPYLNGNKAYGEPNIDFPYQVPDERVFVLGDNRAVSVDSRSTSVGCVTQEQIVGKLVFRIWPLNRIGPIH